MTEEKLQRAIEVRSELNQLREHKKRVEKVLTEIKNVAPESNHAPYLKLERNGYQNGGFQFREEFLNESPQKMVANYLESIDVRIGVLQEFFDKL